MTIVSRSSSSKLEFADLMVTSVDPSSHALFLDLDGTLIDIAATPNEVSVPPHLVALLSDLVPAFNGAVAIVTGRRIMEIDALMNPLKLSAAGVHGCEMRFLPNGAVQNHALSISTESLLGLTAIAAKFPGVIVEPKDAGVALHYRLVPDKEPELRREVSALLADSGAHLIVAHGRMVLEVLPAGFSKGTAIKNFLLDPPFAGRRPIMVGDDAGDVPAFEVAIELGGNGLRVAGEHFSVEGSDFSGPAAVRAWLSRVGSIAEAEQSKARLGRRSSLKQTGS